MSAHPNYRQAMATLLGVNDSVSDTVILELIEIQHQSDFHRRKHAELEELKTRICGKDARL